MASVVAWDDAERVLTEHVRVLVGDDNGAYPTGNSVIVAGTSETAIIDPSITVVARGGAPIPVDVVLTSHSHEDHMAGNGLFSEARLHVHDEDLPGVRTLEGLAATYGLPDAVWAEFRPTVLDQFSFVPRPDAIGFRDGDVFDLGGVTVEAVHLPGHTRGHSGFRISNGVFFCSDIDLTGFGPYYGDAWSDLDQFEDSLDRLRGEDARFYVTYHHKGVIEGRTEFLERLAAFGEVIERRHEAMLEFLIEPRTVDEMVAHRFVYRPHVDIPFAESVERRTATLHIERMLHRNEANEVEPGRFHRT